MKRGPNVITEPNKKAKEDIVRSTLSEDYLMDILEKVTFYLPIKMAIRIASCLSKRVRGKRWAKSILEKYQNMKKELGTLAYQYKYLFEVVNWIKNVQKPCWSDLLTLCLADEIHYKPVGIFYIKKQVNELVVCIEPKHNLWVICDSYFNTIQINNGKFYASGKNKRIRVPKVNCLKYSHDKEEVNMRTHSLEIKTWRDFDKVIMVFSKSQILALEKYDWESVFL